MNLRAYSEDLFDYFITICDTLICILQFFGVLLNENVRLYPKQLFD